MCVAREGAARVLDGAAACGGGGGAPPRLRRPLRRRLVRDAPAHPRDGGTDGARRAPAAIFAAWCCADGILIVAAASSVGLAGSAVLTRLMKAVLYEVSPFDPLVFTAATLSLSPCSCLDLPPRLTCVGGGSGDGAASRLTQRRRPALRDYFAGALGLSSTRISSKGLVAGVLGQVLAGRGPHAWCPPSPE